MIQSWQQSNLTPISLSSVQVSQCWLLASESPVTSFICFTVSAVAIVADTAFSCRCCCFSSKLDADKVDCFHRVCRAILARSNARLHFFSSLGQHKSSSSTTNNRRHSLQSVTSPSPRGQYWGRNIMRLQWWKLREPQGEQRQPAPFSLVKRWPKTDQRSRKKR